MKRALKRKSSASYKHLFLIAILLLSFGLGLLTAMLQPGATLALLILSGVAAFLLLLRGLYLWQQAKLVAFNRQHRAKRPVRQKEEVKR